MKATKLKPDGTRELTQLPVLSDCPIHHMGGGGVTVTHPHKEGDEGIALFCGRSLDAWHQQGGIQSQVDARMHSLSDAIYIPGIRSTPRKLENVSTTSTQMRSDDGKHMFDLHPKNGPSMAADGGKHTIAVNPQSGIALKTAMAMSIDATKGLEVTGKTHFKDAVTSAKSFGAPSTFSNGGGPFTGMLGGFIGFWLGLATLLAVTGSQSPADGLVQARYALAAWGR